MAVMIPSYPNQYWLIRFIFQNHLKMSSCLARPLQEVILVRQKTLGIVAAFSAVAGKCTVELLICMLDCLLICRLFKKVPALCHAMSGLSQFTSN